jgi:hypothetical protein
LLFALALLIAPAVPAAPQGNTPGTAPGREAPELLRDVLVLARTTPESLTVGDRVTLEVHVRAPRGWQVRFPDRVEEGGPVELLDTKVEPPSDRDRKRVEGEPSWLGRYTLAVFQTGDLVLPPWPVEVRADSLWAIAWSDSVRLSVRSVLDDSLAQAGLRDLKPQAELPISRWPWIIAGAVLVAAVAGLVWWLRRRRRPRAEVVPLRPLRPPHDVALEDLRRLEAQHLPVDGKFKEYYVRLTEILRRYLEDGFGVAALEETTEEVLFDLERHRFDRGERHRIGGLLAEADLVKFAKHEPTIEDCRRSLDQVRDCVRATAARSALAQAGDAAAAGDGAPRPGRAAP